MRSSRMRTARTATTGGGLPRGVSAQGGGGGLCPEGGVCPGGSLPGGAVGGLYPGGVCPGGLPRRGVPCDLSHHAFDVTCMLPPPQLRPTNSAAAYIVVVQGMMGYTPLLLTESQTPVKT